MPKVNTEYTVFVSSPGDVGEERRVVLEVVEEVNKLRAKRSSATLKPLTWENDVIPRYGSKPQDIINTSSIDQYDIFLGFMCARFGTKTDNAGSGTEEEFQIAYKKKMESPDDLEVMFYFKDARNSNTEIDGEQLAKVDDFKKQLQSKYKGIHGSFKTAEEFRTEITRQLSLILDEFEDKSTTKVEVVIPEASNLQQSASNGIANPLEQLAAISNGVPEVGFIELVESLELANENIVEKLEPVTESLLELNQNIRIKSAELTKLSRSGSANKSAIKRCLDSSALEMEKFVKRSKDTLPPLQLSMEEHIRAFRNFLLIFGEVNIGNSAEKTELANSIAILLDSIKSAAESFDKFQKSATNLPRLTKRLNMAKREVAAISEGTSTMLMSAHTQLESLSTPLMR